MLSYVHYCLFASEFDAEVAQLVEQCFQFTTNSNVDDGSKFQYPLGVCQCQRKIGKNVLSAQKKRRVLGTYIAAMHVKLNINISPILKSGRLGKKMDYRASV